MTGELLPWLSVDGQSRAVQALYEQESIRMEEIKQELLAELNDLRHGKSIYDEHFPWFAKHLYGDASFAHEVFKKSARAASLVAAGVTGQAKGNKWVDALEDNLFDLLNFTVMWMSWRRFRREEKVNYEDGTHSTEGAY